MSITLESSDFDAINDFRVAAGMHLPTGQKLATDLDLEIQQSAPTLACDTTLWAVALARAKALIEIGAPHPAVLQNLSRTMMKLQRLLHFLAEPIICGVSVGKLVALPLLSLKKSRP